MAELENRLRAARDGGRKLLVPYVTGGIDADWVAMIEAYADAGADAVEVGIPFSDPVMDGPTIQEASEVALGRGVDPQSLLQELRALDVDIPLVAMTYYNVAYRMGHERFASELTAAGIGGVVLPDLPLEEASGWLDVAPAHGIDTVLLAAPNASDARLRVLTAASAGFFYGVNLLGVTGERDTVARSSTALAARLKAVTDIPVIMGFGISTVEQACEIASVADGVIVASALMRKVLDGASPDDLGAFVAEWRAALDAL